MPLDWDVEANVVVASNGAAAATPSGPVRLSQALPTVDVCHHYPGSPAGKSSTLSASSAG